MAFFLEHKRGCFVFVLLVATTPWECKSRPLFGCILDLSQVFSAISDTNHGTNLKPFNNAEHLNGHL